MSLVKTSLLSFMATVIKMIAGLVINKAVALFIGPAGLALIGQFQNFLQLTMVIAQGAITSGVTKYTAEYGVESAKLPILLGTATKIMICSSTIVAILIFLFSNQLSRLVLETGEYSHIFLMLAISIFFFVINSFLLAILNGLKEIKTWISINISQSIVSLVFTSILIYFFGLSGALTALVLNQSLVLLIAGFLIKKHSIINLTVLRAHFSCTEAKKLSGYALMTLTSAILVPSTQLVIRNHLGETISWEAAGYWQAVWYISSTYLSIITTALGVYYLPRLSEIKSAGELRLELIAGFKLILPFVTALAFAIYLLKDFVIWLLFSKDFFAVRELFLWQLVGDVIKMSSWLLAYIMISKALKKQFIATEIIFSISFVLFSMVLTNEIGLIGVTYAYALNYFLYLITVFSLTKSYWLTK